MYGVDLGARDIPKGVARLNATTLSGADAYNVLDRPLRSPTNVKWSNGTST